MVLAELSTLIQDGIFFLGDIFCIGYVQSCILSPSAFNIVRWPRNSVSCWIIHEISVLSYYNNMWWTERGYFFSEILQFIRRYGKCLLQIADCDMHPVRKENFVNDLPVVEVLWIFRLQFIDIVGDFRGHRLKAYIPALFEARTLLYRCKRLG